MSENWQLYAYIYIYRLFGFYLYQSVFHHYTNCMDTWFEWFPALNMNSVLGCLCIIRDIHWLTLIEGMYSGILWTVCNYSESNNSGITIIKMPTYIVYRLTAGYRLYHTYCRHYCGSHCRTAMKAFFVYFVSKWNVCYSFIFIYIHMLSY